RCAQQVNVHTILGRVRELRVDYSTGCGPRRAGDYWCLSEPVGRECHVLTAATTGRVYTHTPGCHSERQRAVTISRVRPVKRAHLQLAITADIQTSHLVTINLIKTNSRLVTNR